MNIPPRADRTGNAVTGVSGRELSGVELAQRSESVVMIAVCDQQGNIIGNGSGIAVGANGFILTNCHVVRKGSGFAARFENDDRPYPVQVIKYHTINDMALLRVNRSLKPLPLYRGQRGELVRGQKVIAIGSPMGLLNTVSDGIISGFRKVGEIEAIQFTAPISPGSSGGALLNAYGELIGMCFGGIEDGQNLNLAINYKDIYPFISGFLGK